MRRTSQAALRSAGMFGGRDKREIPRAPSSDRTMNALAASSPREDASQSRGPGGVSHTHKAQLAMSTATRAGPRMFRPVPVQAVLSAARTTTAAATA